MRRLIIGDIHGRYKALRQVLERAEYNPEEDILYSVGDFCDRGEENLEVLKYLMTLKNFRPVLGNHDAWLQSYLRDRDVDDNWYRNNGGDTTVKSLYALSERERQEISEWLNAIPYCRIEDDIIVVHGGPIKGYELEEITRPRDFRWEYFTEDIPGELWDRTYLQTAVSYEEWLVSEAKESGISFAEYLKRDWGAYCVDFSEGEEPFIASEDKTIYTGHSIIKTGPFESEKFHLVSLDTGAAIPDGRLTCVNIDRKTYWQSAIISDIE